MNNLLAIAIGGILGCWARYGVSVGIQALVGKEFPYATLLINVLGSFLIGFLFIVTLERTSDVSASLRLGILVGGIGGFTTFSTFAMEALLLAEEGRVARAITYVTLSVFLGLSAAFIGATLGRRL